MSKSAFSTLPLRDRTAPAGDHRASNLSHSRNASAAIWTNFCLLSSDATASKSMITMWAGVSESSHVKSSAHTSGVTTNCATMKFSVGASALRVSALRDCGLPRVPFPCFFPRFPFPCCPFACSPFIAYADAGGGCPGCRGPEGRRLGEWLRDSPRRFGARCARKFVPQLRLRPLVNPLGRQSKGLRRRLRKLKNL